VEVAVLIEETDAAEPHVRDGEPATDSLDGHRYGEFARPLAGSADAHDVAAFAVVIAEAAGCVDDRHAPALQRREIGDLVELVVGLAVCADDGVRDGGEVDGRCAGRGA
jgi:hypothetical protein